MENFWHSLLSLLKDVFTNGKSFIRFLFLLLTLSVLLFLAVFCIHKYLGGNLNIKSNDNGVTVITGNGALENEKMFAILSLPSSICWFNTGIILQPNESILIKASGVIHTSADKLFESAKLDSEPPFDWNDASGRPFIQTNRYRDRYRANYFIFPSNPQRIGNILAYLKEPNEETPSKDYPRPKGGYSVFDVSRNNKVKNKSTEPCTLFLTVNDIVFERTEEAKKAYTGNLTEIENKEEKTKYYRSLKHWQEIENHESWDIFFKDNIGTFLIQIERINE